VDEQLHQTLARISRNPMYISILQTLHENIHPYFENFLPREPHVIEENFKDLCDIVHAVESKDAHTASQLAQRHVRRFTQYMIQYQQEKNSKGPL
jgi:DNA-binding FadR family transcriptional regulator